MLSKAKGQILRVAAALHTMFDDSIDPETGEMTLPPIASTISTKAVSAAIDIVDTCCQHTAFMAGRGNIEDEIKQLTTGKLIFMYLCVCACVCIRACVCLCACMHVCEIPTHCNCIAGFLATSLL